MTKVYQVIEINNNENWTVLATKMTREGAESVINNFPSDYMSNISLTILEVYTNQKPKDKWFKWFE